MKPPPLPANEPERLRALRDSALLDTPPEPDWDDFTRLASAVTGAPMALVTLVDRDRQWFKSRFGLEQRELPRDHAFCAYAILGDGLMEVRDAGSDERFRDNPLVAREPHVRFYAGAPIVTEGGHALGTVCVMDDKPRELTPAQRDALSALARKASARLRVRDEARQLASAREEAENSLALVRSTLDATSEGIVCIDSEGRVLVANERFLAMFDLTADHVARGRVSPVLEAAVRMKDPEGYRRMLEEQEKRPEEDRFDVVELADGRILERYSRPARAGGRVVGRVNCFRDVTERRQIENLKNEFVSTVSHELRTPLTAIRGALGLLEAGVVGELPAQAKEFVTISRTNCERLIRLVNDILDLEKLEAGKVDLTLGELDAVRLVETSLSNVRPLADAADVTLVSRVTTPQVYGDEDRLVQVFTNLLSNAVKFSPRGGTVEIAVARKARGGVRVEVRDRGPGIAPDARHKLFRRFQQLDQSDTRPKGGTGLGLAICKAIVEQHRGTVGADGRAGGGTVFWLELPAAAAPQPPESRSILIGVAQPALAARLQAAVSSAGGLPIVVGTLAEAEQSLKNKAAKAAIIEVRMPDGEAIEWLARLRNAGAHPVPVALVHQEGTTFAPPLIIDAGETSSDARLLRALCTVAAAPRGARVLVADDDAGFRQVLVAQLQRLGVDVVEAQDGAEAVTLARKLKPHVIVLDVGMPGLDGFDVVDLLRQETAKSAALLVYSGRTLGERDRERLRLGVTRFLTKGVATESQLLDAVKQLVTAATAE